jgi:hypothetical protein
MYSIGKQWDFSAGGSDGAIFYKSLKITPVLLLSKWIEVSAHQITSYPSDTFYHVESTIIRSEGLSNAGSGHCLDGWPPENSRSIGISSLLVVFLCEQSPTHYLIVMIFLIDE